MTTLDREGGVEAVSSWLNRRDFEIRAVGIGGNERVDAKV